MNTLAPDTVRLTPEHLDEIRASVDWQAMFGGLGLRKAEGKSKPNDWWAFSPFHEEKTPSFHMGPGGLWFDYVAVLVMLPICDLVLFYRRLAASTQHNVRTLRGFRDAP